MADASISAKALWDEEQGRPYWGEKTYALAQRFVNRFGFIRQQEDKEEVLHDFATKNPQMEGFNGRAKFSTWLYSCLFRQAVDFARKKYLLRIPEERRPREVSIDTPKEDDKGKDFRAELADEKFGNHPTLESLMEYDIVYSWPNYCVLKVFDGTQYRDVTDEEWSIFYQEFDFDSFMEMQNHVQSCASCEQRVNYFTSRPTSVPPELWKTDPSKARLLMATQRQALDTEFREKLCNTVLPKLVLRRHNYGKESKPPVKPRRWDKTRYALARKVMDGFGFIEQQDKELIIREFALENSTFDEFDGLCNLEDWLFSSLALKATDFGWKKYCPRNAWRESLSPFAGGGEKRSLQEELAAHESLTGHPTLKELFQFDLVWGWGAYSDYFVLDGTVSRHLNENEWRTFFRALRIDEYKKLFENHVIGCSHCYYLVTSYGAPGQATPDFMALNEVIHRILRSLVLPDPHPPLARISTEGTADMVEGAVKAKTETKRQRVCGNCGEVGHNRRTCKPKS